MHCDRRCGLGEAMDPCRRVVCHTAHTGRTGGVVVLRLLVLCGVRCRSHVPRCCDCRV